MAALSVQVAKLVVEESRVKLTVPVGVVEAELDGLSLMVAVQISAPFTATAVEAQLMPAAVDWRFTFSPKLPWLPE